MEEPESLIHLFRSFAKTIFLCTQLQHSFQNVLTILPITPQRAFFGFADHKVNYQLINNILLIFKWYVYNTRENGSFNLTALKRNNHKIKNVKPQQTRKT